MCKNTERNRLASPWKKGCDSAGIIVKGKSYCLQRVVASIMKPGRIISNMLSKDTYAN